MACSAEFYGDWRQYNGRKVLIDGLTHTLVCREFTQRYPYTCDMIDVSAEPNRNTKSYRETKQRLGDDWSVDVLASDCELQADILRQLQPATAPALATV